MAGTLLVIGFEGGDLARIAAVARDAGCDVARCASISQAVTELAATSLEPVLVAVDADCCGDRAGPAYTVLRARVRARFLVACEASGDARARSFPCDAVVEKAAAAEQVRALLPPR